jgi:hypothetical protein
MALSTLLNLISFRQDFIILNIDPRVTLSGRFINPVTAPGLPGRTKIMVTDFAQVIETDPFRFLAQAGEQFFNFCHA